LHTILGDKVWNDSVLFTNFNLIFFAVLFITAFIKDGKANADYSKWMYFISAIGIFDTMVSIFNKYYKIYVNDNIVWPQIFILSVVYFILGTVIQRKPFTIAGILGMVSYIIYLEFQFIKNNTTLLTCFILITGLLILCAGVFYNKNIDKTRFI